MNPIKTFAYRTYQTVFKLAIPILPYRSPAILDSVQKVPEVLQKENAGRVLLVTDRFLNSSGMIEPLKKALEEAGIGCTVYDETVPNPTIENVEAARQLYIKEGCKALIGFGGGSSIDCAKAVGARIARPNKTIPNMRGVLHVMRKIPFLIAIPTTAGTGSETTLATVITDGDSAHKFPINDFVLIPRAAVLDPEMTRTLPQGLTATTGMDALTHAVEAYIGRSTVKETRADALKAARLIAENLENAYRDGNDRTARANMLTGQYAHGRVPGGPGLLQILCGLLPRGGPLSGRKISHSPRSGQRGASALCAGGLRSRDL